MNNYSVEINMRKRSDVKINNNTYKISEKIIDNVKCPKLFIENTYNYWIQANLKEVLRISMERDDGYQYGEIGMLLNTLDYSRQIFYGNYHRVTFDKNILLDSPKNSLINIHNHPSNKHFSYIDINFLVSNDSVGTLIVIGNLGNIYILDKQLNYDKVLALNYIRKHRNVEYILSTSSNINIEYTFYKRRYI